MAEALFRKKYPEAEVKSAGIFASSGAPASVYAENVLEEKEISLSHTSDPVTEELLNWADLVLTMTMQHKRELILTYPDSQEKYYTLKEYTEETDATQTEPNLDSDLDIRDPFGGDVEAYRNTRDELDEQTDLLVTKLRRNKGETR
jgi:protein-tyrosine phosphatase